jgi:hypothetical protein
MDRAAVFDLLHLDPQHRYASEVDTLIERASELARPRAVYQVALVERKETDSVVIAEDPRGLEQALEGSSTRTGAQTRRARFVSPVLRANLDPVVRVFPYVATCGREMDSIPIADGDVFSQFCWDAIKEMALHVALSHLFDHLKEAHELESLSSMNPGSGELEVWPIEQQKELFGFFGSVEDLIGVELTDSRRRADRFVSDDPQQIRVRGLLRVGARFRELPAVPSRRLPQEARTVRPSPLGRETRKATLIPASRIDFAKMKRVRMRAVESREP